jgi:hypothetical protein
MNSKRAGKSQNGVDTRGPVIMGTIKTGIKQQVYWEFGALAGLQKETPDMNLRLLVEVEF